MDMIALIAACDALDRLVVSLRAVARPHQGHISQEVEIAAHGIRSALDAAPIEEPTTTTARRSR